jgi:ligand-binding sensor domain-containing protein
MKDSPPFNAGQFIRLLAATLLITGMPQGCNQDDPDPVTGFTFESVTGFVISDQGTKLLATDAGLCSLDVDRGIYTEMENPLKSYPLNDLGFSLTPQDGELWIASNEGVCNFTMDDLFTEGNSGLQNDQVIQIGFNYRNLAFFASSDGLSLLNEDTWSQYSGLDDLFQSHEISDIGSATNGYTYVTTYGGGIERFKAGPDGISGATLMDTDWTRLESDYIYSVYIDDTTQVYGTDLGVAFHFSEYTKWDWEVYTTSDGLVNDTVLSVTRDPSGNWWIGTAQGISMFDGTQWISYTSDQHDMTGNRAEYLAVDQDGSVWMASDGGLSHFTGGQWVSYPKLSP